MARVATVAFTRYDSDPRVRRMAEALAARGDQVMALVLAEPGKPRRRVLNGVDVVGIPIPQYRGSSSIRYVLQYLGFVLLAGWRLTWSHLLRRFDVVHANNMPDFVVFAALPAKLLGSAVILDIHDPMPEMFASKFGGNGRGLVRRLVEGSERISIRFADRVISVHDVQLETLLGRGHDPEKFSIVQNVPDDRYFPPGSALNAAMNRDRTGVTVMYHGLIAHRLGIDVAVRAMEQVRRDADGVRLVLIGDGDAADQIEELVESLELAEVVDFKRGFIPVEGLLPHLLEADIGVVPARLDPFTRNMLPTKLIEYVALGIASISTDLPAVRRYFTSDQVLMVSADDPGELAAAIVTLVRDKDLRRSRALEAMTFLEGVNWATERARYLELVDELASSG